MKRIYPHHIIYLLLHLILTIIGYMLVISEDQVIKAVGTSLIAAGITGWVIFIYIFFSRSMKKKIEILSEFGLEGAFEARGTKIQDEYDQRISNAKNNIDILGFGLNTLRGDYSKEFENWKKNVKVRILLLDPEYPIRKYSYADQRDREENNNEGSIDMEVKKFISDTKLILDDQFCIKLYKCLPVINIFRVDKELFWGPYLLSKQSRNSPTFLVKEGGHLFSTFKEHFDSVWESDKFSRDIPPEWIK